MSRVRFVDVPALAIGPYVDGLRALEREIEYPIDDGRDTFRIDHGTEYHKFFSTLGEAQFVLALDGDRVVGTIAGMMRQACARGTMIPSVYGADIKIAREYRGQGIVQRMLFFALRDMVRQGELTTWRYAYIAAMRGARGDVMRTVKGAHLGRLARPAATLGVYFVAPEKLASLSIDDAPKPPRVDEGLDLSPARAALIEPPGLTSTAGRKDLFLRSTGAPWPLVHLPLGPSGWGASWGRYLKTCGEALVARGTAGPACFAIDLRLDDHVSWLARNGVERGAVATVYALNLSLRAMRPKWVHLATSEI
jgi:hypothetical protein